MEIKLNSKDTIELAKAIHCGRLDVSKVDALKALVKDFRPFEPMEENEFKAILRFLKTHGYMPTHKMDWRRFVKEEATDTLEEYGYDTDSSLYQLYEELLRAVHRGVLAMAALGGRFEIKEMPKG